MTRTADLTSLMLHLFNIQIASRAWTCTKTAMANRRASEHTSAKPGLLRQWLPAGHVRDKHCTQEAACSAREGAKLQAEKSQTAWRAMPLGAKNKTQRD